MEKGANQGFGAIGVIPESTVERLRIDVAYCRYNHLDDAVRRARACSAWMPRGTVRTLALAPAILDEDCSAARLFHEPLLRTSGDAQLVITYLEEERDALAAPP